MFMYNCMMQHRLRRILKHSPSGVLRRCCTVFPVVPLDIELLKRGMKGRICLGEQNDRSFELISIHKKSRKTY